MVFPLVVMAAFAGAALVLGVMVLTAATGLAGTFFTGLATIGFATGAAFSETTGLALATGAGFAGTTTGSVATTVSSATFAAGAGVTAANGAATLSTVFALSAGTLATIGLHCYYVAVHNIESGGKFQAFFVRCTK
jgi:hypothetical protein